MLRWSHHVDIFGTLHFIVRCLADRSEGPLPPCSCRRRRCSCTPPASASSPTSAKDIESRPNHVDSWSPAREELMGKHTYIHTYIPPSGVVHKSEVHKSEVHKWSTVVVRQCIGTTPSAELYVIIPHGINSEKPPLYLLPTHLLLQATD